MIALWKKFGSNEQGAVAIFFSLALIPIIGLTGIAIDYSSASKARVSYQAIVDSAALAGATAATNDTDAQRKTRAETWLSTEAARLGAAPTSSAVTVNNGEVTVTASFVHQSLFKIQGMSMLQVDVRSVALLTQEALHRVLDVAMCIDATGSMQGTINSVKARARSFSDDLNNALKAKNLTGFDYMRIRVIYYRDFGVDFQPMVKSAFMEMPTKKTEFETFVASQSASGGGDLPESGYVCINEGMQSNWFKTGDPIPGTAFNADEVYPVIILWTDADTKPVEYAIGSTPAFTVGMPSSDSAFKAKWNNPSVIDQKNRLLMMFGPCSRASWALGRSLTNSICGGTLSEGNANMISKISDVMVSQYKNKMTRLAR